MDEIILHVEADVSSTESEEKVRQAVEKVFGNIATETKPTHRGSLLTGQAGGRDALTSFHDLLRREHIRSAARIVLLDGVYGKTVSFCLNKQVAYVGHISFSKEVGESPLGPIRVKITCEDPRQLVEWLTSRTM
jgi:predicted RNA binding protein with dsRBD fold (UPF0201 family)